MVNLNKRMIVLGLWVYCFLLLPPSSSSAMDLSNARTAFLGGDYNGCVNYCEKLLAGVSHSQDTEELYFLLGLGYLKEGNYLRASDIFEIILKEFNHGRFKEEACLGLGDAYFLNGNYEKAEKQYQGIINGTYHKLRPLAYYRVSQCAFKQGKAQQAGDFLARLEHEYPLSMELISNRDSSSPEQCYSVQVGSFSNPANARNLVQKLVQKGYSAYMEEGTLSGKAAYKVKAGKSSLLREAESLRDKLTQEGYPTKICP